MTDSLQSVLRQSVADVLEKMFFIRPFDDSEGEPRVRESELTVCLTFEGEPSGSLRLAVTRAAARSISADFLGVEDCELTQQHVNEVICELANMICGSVLSRVESSAAFRLGPPQLADDDSFTEEPAEAGGERVSHTMEIGGGSLTVSLITESPVCSTAEKLAF